MDERIFFARTLDKNPDTSCWQKLETHLQETAELTAKFNSGMPWEKWAYYSGLWHDLGKYSDAFQKRLMGSKIKVVHSTAGAKAAEKVFNDIEKNEPFIARMLEYIIAGHHAGLPDGNSPDNSCLTKRLLNDKTFHFLCNPKFLEKPELSLKDINDLCSNRKDTNDFAFGLSFFIRMLFSSLVDADRLNSAAFVHPDNANQRNKYSSLNELNIKLTKKLNELSSKNQEEQINQYRALILSDCLAAADKPPGLFSLTVPTGGGKTLSSLAFALKHALKYGLKRVIYVIPYTSIIEQNAKVFRECLGNKSVIEHHSNYDPPEKNEEVTLHSLATENWDAPIIVTTNVQFFESLFSHRPSSCRKIHNIMNSVIILDEAQMLPTDLLRPCVEAIRELGTRYNTSVVLCTATQPALNHEDEFKNGLDGVYEIIKDRESLYNDLKRVDIKLIGKKDNSEIACLLADHKQVLCIVNTRKRAREIYDMLPDSEGKYHLSSMMCPEHRTDILNEIRKRLSDGSECRVVSTQLIEAGVDIDFPKVYRELAGVDSITQAAGRCNRERRLPHNGEVSVFETTDGVPTIFRQQAQTTQTVISHHGEEILSLDAIREYFQELYWKKGEEQLDSLRIFDLLEPGLDTLDFPFREIGEKFKIIKQNTVSLVIPWEDKGKAIAKEISGENPSRKTFRKAQRYTVSVYPESFQQLYNAGAVQMINKSLAVLTNEDIYCKKVGLNTDNPYYWEPESLMQ